MVLAGPSLGEERLVIHVSGNLFCDTAGQRGWPTQFRTISSTVCLSPTQVTIVDEWCVVAKETLFGGRTTRKQLDHFAAKTCRYRALVCLVGSATP